MDLKDQDGLEYKRALIKLLERGRLNLTDLEGNLIDLSKEEEEEDVTKSENESAETENEEGEEGAKNFQSKILEMKEKLDEFITMVAKLNTELNMMTKAIPAVGAFCHLEDVNLESFVWKFNINFEWDNKNVCLPILLVDDIKILDDALADEIIYHDIVSFDSIL